jgi:hypothetical protein
MTKIKLILPKNRVTLNLQKGERFYFLAGPIRGAADWQATAIKMLAQKDPNCYIACPCRYDESHELFQYGIPDNTNEILSEASNTLKYLDEDKPHLNLEPFPSQTMWERHYLVQASMYGAVIFWLPCEDKQNPRKKEDGPYARDTYGELGRWSQRSNASEKMHNLSRVNLIIGAENDFPGLSVIQKNFDADHGRPFPIYSSLEETIAEAVKLGKKTNPQPLFNSENA